MTSWKEVAQETRTHLERAWKLSSTIRDKTVRTESEQEREMDGSWVSKALRVLSKSGPG